MSDFIEMVNRYTGKYHSKIKSLTQPLKQHLGISSFSYTRTEKEGNYCSIGDCPEIQEYYHAEKLFMGNPYSSHPDLVQSGTLLFPDLHNLAYKKTLHEALKIRCGFIIVQNLGNAVECFYFDSFIKDQLNPCVFLTYLDMLYNFIKFFKREANWLINNIIQDGFNIKKIKGSLFFTNNSCAPLIKNRNTKGFMQAILPLSQREAQCLELLRQGKTSQATGAILGISPRTVEYYFENLKNKFGCSSKFDLLNLL